MNGMESLLTGPLGQAIGWALLHLLWQGVLVAAILAAALALLQRQSANARYLASCGALMLLVALAAATAYRAYDARTYAVTSAPATSAIEEVSSSSDDPSVTPARSETAAPPESSWSEALAPIVTFTNAHLSQIVAIWLAGVLILSTRLIFGWIGAHRLTQNRSHRAAEHWKHSLDQIAAKLRLRRSITLLESAAVQVPTVVGWLRPVVLLPAASLSGLSVQQIEMVLAHELAHVRRHDFIVNLMQSVVETLLFYHPAVWWISRQIRVEREHCCDDLAVAVFGDPVQYARALTRFEELRLDSQTVVAANGGSLFERIHRLVVARAESANWSSRWAAGAALLTVVSVILIAPALPIFASHEEQTPPPKAEKPAPPPAPDDEKQKAKTREKSDATVEVDADESDDSMDSADEPDEPTPPPVPAVAPRVMTAPMVRVAPAIAVAPAAPMIHIDVDDMVYADRHRRHIGEGGKLSVDDLIALRTAGVDPKYIEEMRGAGLGDLSLDDIVSMRIQGVTPAYIKEMAAAGYPKLTARDLISMRIQGVTPKYVQDLANAGYRNLSPRDLISMRIQGVDSNFVKSLAEAGYTNLTPKELIRLRVSGVDADFIRELQKYRTK
jgi:beta-lactamase regulating signal transducer with metallopeptidase domain